MRGGVPGCCYHDCALNEDGTATGLHGVRQLVQRRLKGGCVWQAWEEDDIGLC
jgi:hypothetical protein